MNLPKLTRNSNTRSLLALMIVGGFFVYIFILAEHPEDHDILKGIIGTVFVQVVGHYFNNRKCNHEDKV